MKLFLLLLAIFVCIVVADAGPSSCNACFEDAANNGNDLEQCIGVQYQFNCSNMTFPNVGSAHCYTAAGWYRQNNMLKTGIIRGCINCTDMQAAKQQLRTAFDALQDWTLTDDFTLLCCNTTDCNSNLNATAPALPTTTMMTASASVGAGGGASSSPTPTSHASCLFPVIGILAFAAAVICAVLI